MPIKNLTKIAERKIRETTHTYSLLKSYFSQDLAVKTHLLQKESNPWPDLLYNLSLRIKPEDVPTLLKVYESVQQASANIPLDDLLEPIVSFETSKTNLFKLAESLYQEMNPQKKK